jgi:hypothetical protein
MKLLHFALSHRFTHSRSFLPPRHLQAVRYRVMMLLSPRAAGSLAVAIASHAHRVSSAFTQLQRSPTRCFAILSLSLHSQHIHTHTRAHALVSLCGSLRLCSCSYVPHACLPSSRMADALHHAPSLFLPRRGHIPRLSTFFFIHLAESGICSHTQTHTASLVERSLTPVHAHRRAQVARFATAATRGAACVGSAASTFGARSAVSSRMLAVRAVVAPRQGLAGWGGSRSDNTDSALLFPPRCPSLCNNIFLSLSIAQLSELQQLRRSPALF